MITDNFIKQCEASKEIQKEWAQTVADIFIYKHDIENGCYFYITEHKKYVNAIWLPTLEQLFEIAHRAYNKNAHYKSKEYEIIADFVEWMLNSDIDKYKDFNLDFDDTKSCLLIYIMEEFYHKIWTGEKWVKETN